MICIVGKGPDTFGPFLGQSWSNSEMTVRAIPGGSSNTTTSVICPRSVPMPGSEISAGLDCFCKLVQKKYDSSDDDASLPHGPQDHLEYQGICCRRSVPWPSEGPYTSRMPTRSAKDTATGILLMLGVDLLDGMCLTYIPLAGIATTSTVQPKLSKQLTVHGA